LVGSFHLSGVGIFCVGCGLSIYHGIDGILHPEPITDLFWVYCILMGSLVSEGATLVVAINELKRAAKENSMTFKDYGEFYKCNMKIYDVVYHLF